MGFRVMRVTNDTKQATRRRILESARRLFTDRGFEQATTRDLAQAAGIAVGTLFNYFPTKEEVAMTLVAEALQEAQDDFAKHRRPDDSLEEQLFGLIAAGLRRLKPCRNFVQPTLEIALSPVARSAASPQGEALRLEHLEQVQQMLAPHVTESLAPVALQLYWTLYTGVLAFWARDTSHKQEDTLALLDEVVRMLLAWLKDHPQS